MKIKILLVTANFYLFFFLSNSNSIGQAVMKFSPSTASTGEPFITGQIKNRYFCVYPTDSVPQLVIYNPELREVSSFSWNSIIPGESFIASQAFTLEDKLSVLLQEKTNEGLKIRCIDLDENGTRVSDRILVTDSAPAGSSLIEYHIEISKNSKYVLLYRGVRINSDGFLFKGYLFDNNWNIINQFQIPVEKHETEDNWFGAMVDIEGNIQSFVFSAADSWRKGTKLRIHSISRLNGEMKSEQIEIGRKRLINYVVREDTLSHFIQLQAIATRQQTKDPLDGLAFISFPFQRNGKISYSSYDFSREQKKRLAKDITSGSNLLERSVIESPSSFTQGGLFFTSILVEGDSSGFKKRQYENQKLLKADEFNNITTLPMRNTYGSSPYNSAISKYQNPTANYDRVNRYSKSGVETNKKNSYPVRLTILTNTPNGTSVFWAEKNFHKANRPFYTGSFSFVKDNTLKMLAYIFDTDKPVLYLLTTSDQIEMKKIEIPENILLLLSDARLVNENTCLIPYVNSKTREYGIAKFVF